MEFFASWVFRCRVWVYLKMNYPELEAPSKVVKKGFEAERKFEEFLKLVGVKYVKQPKGKIELENFSVIGKADFLTEKCVIEVKNSSRNFPIEWIAQLNLYMKIFDVEKGILVKFHGDGVKMKTFEFDKELYEKSLEYFSWFLENKPDFPKGCSAKLCSFRHVCLNMGKR